MVFGIDTTLDSPDAHPQHFCHSCKNVLYRASKAGYVHRTEVFQGWNDHTNEGSCYVCQHYETLKKGGRPKKVGRTPGRPSNNCPRYCAENIRAIALPPSFVLAHHTPPRICEEHEVVDLKELNCPICCEVLKSPAELINCQVCRLLLLVVATLPSCQLPLLLQ